MIDTRAVFASVLTMASLLAQCPRGTTAGLVPWQASTGYASVAPAADEGITSPPVVLSPPFFMPGAVGSLDRMWVSSNGEVYFTDSSLALTQPVNAAAFGINDLAEMRGATPGASPRVAVLGGDHQPSAVAGASWDVSIDSSVAGQTTVTWVDMARFVNTTDRFSFQAQFTHATGVVTMRYGTTIPAPSVFPGRVVGISIGNGVGLASTPPSDLSTAPSSGSLGLLYQNFAFAGPWDLTGQSLRISPNGVGGYVASPLTPYSSGPCATTIAYGTGCYTVNANSLYQTFATTVAAKAALDGRSMTFVRNQSGYVAVWNGSSGPAFVPPTASATLLTAFSNYDNGSMAISPSTPIPTPGGPVATWNVSVNGILTAAPLPNNPGDFTPTGLEVTIDAQAPQTAFYCWHDQVNYMPSSLFNGISTWEAGGFLYVTWNTVDNYDLGHTTGTTNPSTWQYRVSLATGDVTIVWASMDTSPTSDLPTVVGATLPGAGDAPGAVVLATGLPLTLSTSTVQPLTLTAGERPVITLGGAGPSRPITYTLTNIVAAAPPSPIGLSWLLFSLGADVAGTDLAPHMPGCNVHLTSIDAVLSFPGAVGTDSLVVTFPQPLVPGLAFHAQALSLLPPGSGPGLNPLGARSSNGITTTFQLQ